MESRAKSESPLFLLGHVGRRCPRKPCHLSELRQTHEPPIYRCLIRPPLRHLKEPGFLLIQGQHRCVVTVRICSHRKPKNYKQQAAAGQLLSTSILSFHGLCQFMKTCVKHLPFYLNRKQGLRLPCWLTPQLNQELRRWERHPGVRSPQLPRPPAAQEASLWTDGETVNTGARPKA